MKFSQRHRAFTLVEILIVIAIVAILGAILFSVFSRARETSRSTTCNANLKQIGLAMKLYTQDNAGYVPNVSGTAAGQDIECAWADRIFPYIRKTQIFECPNHELNEYVPDCPPRNEPMMWDGSYQMNILSAPGHVFTRESRLQHPTSTISVLDGNGSSIQPGGYERPLTWQRVAIGLPPARHHQKYNVLFMDGHTKAMRIEEFGVLSLWTADDHP